jgi:hypothetical protein
MNPQFALQKNHNKLLSQSSTTTKLFHCPEQTSLGLDTEGRLVEVDGGGATMTKSGERMA